jgi:D-glycero-D-manno-heptose 1,7-bisphosphate phosphatase
VVESSKAVFLDRDGVIVRGKIINNKLYAPRDINLFYFYPKVLNNLNNLKKLGFKLFIITNQPDLGNNKISLETLSKMHNLIINNLPIDKIYMCTHSQKANCKCRKPKPYLIKKASKENNIDLSKSYLIGDRWSDIKAGFDSGCRNIFINRHYKEKQPREQIKTVYSLAGAVRYILSMN